MKRSTRAEKAQQTLTIIEHGFYETENQGIDIRNEINNSLEHTILYRNDEFDVVMDDVDARLKTLNYNTGIRYLLLATEIPFVLLRGEYPYFLPARKVYQPHGWSMLNHGREVFFIRKHKAS